MSDPDPRMLLMEIHSAALRAVDGRRVVRGWLRRHPVDGAVYLIAIGKAATSMMRGALDVLGEGVARALMITGYGQCECDGAPGFECLEAGHPLPDHGSLMAGRRLLEFIDSAPMEAGFLFLISGGSSALVELLPEGVTLEDLRRMNGWLLGSGLDIHALNSVRIGVSCIKGGRLALRLNGRSALNLVLSDVPGDDPATIGSGLLVAAQHQLRAGELPGRIERACLSAPPLPRPEDPCFRRVRTVIVAGNRQALDAAAEEGRARGLQVHLHPQPFAGDARELGERFARKLLDGPAGLWVWGGESTVTLPPSPGRGGRCQNMALAAARVLNGSSGILFMAAGTDGRDGPGAAAGAVVDGGTVARGERQGLDACRALQGADAGRFLEASGDLLRTGPTGTNVMDLVLALKI